MDGEYILGRGDCLANDRSRKLGEKFSSPGKRWGLRRRLGRVLLEESCKRSRAAGMTRFVLRTIIPSA